MLVKLKQESVNGVPFIFAEKNMQMQNQERATLIEHLKRARIYLSQPLHEDWIIVIHPDYCFFIFFNQNNIEKYVAGCYQVFPVQGINEPSSRDTGGLFHWQSTILNLISFLIIGLFAYYAASYYDLIPSGIRGIIFWLISLGIIISACHFTTYCLHINRLCKRRKKEVFREYLLGVYLSYRFSALLLFVLIILMSYTMILPPEYILSEEY